MEDLTAYCPPGTQIKDEMMAVTEQVSLRVITFTPGEKTKNPSVVFIAGWITKITAWQKVLLEMTKDFTVYYIETREKISSNIRGNVNFGVDAIGADIVTIISRLNLEDYILFGSSLGATVILDCCRFLKNPPLGLILIGPNALFRAPKSGLAVVRIFPPGIYLVFKPFVKWYLKTFRLDIKSDYAQYEKYCGALDAADPYKLKKAMLALSKYTVWDFLKNIKYPTLLIGASKDTLHEPANLQKMNSILEQATYLDMETNERTHSPDVVVAMRNYLFDLSRTSSD